MADETLELKVISLADENDVKTFKVRRALLESAPGMLGAMFSGVFADERTLKVPCQPAALFGYVVDALRLHAESDAASNALTEANVGTNDDDDDALYDAAKLVTLRELFDYFQIETRYIQLVVYTRQLARHAPSWLQTKLEDDRRCVAYVSEKPPLDVHEGVIDVFADGNDWKLELPPPGLPLLFQSWGAFSGLRRSNAGRRAIVSTRDKAVTEFHRASRGLFKGDFDWSNVIVAGGCALACVMSTSRDGLEGEVGRPSKAMQRNAVDRNRYEDYYRASYATAKAKPGDVEAGAADPYFNDIDLFVYAVNEEQATAIVRRVLTHLNKRLEALDGDAKIRVCVVRSRLTVTWVGERRLGHSSNAADRVLPRVQIVLRIYRSPAEVVHGFDIDACSVFFDGASFYATQRAARALKTRTNLVDLARLSPSYGFRMYKYALRGFGVAVPGFARDAVVGATLYEKPAFRLRGLAQLIVLEQRHFLPLRTDVAAVIGEAKGKVAASAAQHSSKDLRDTREFPRSGGYGGWYSRRNKNDDDPLKQDKRVLEGDLKLGDAPDLIGKDVGTEVSIEDLGVQRHWCDYEMTFLPISYGPLELLAFLGAREVVHGEAWAYVHYRWRRNGEEARKKRDEEGFEAPEIGFVHAGPRNYHERYMGVDQGWSLEPIFDTLERSQPTPLTGSNRTDSYAWCKSLKRSIPRFLEHSWQTKNPIEQRLTGSFHPTKNWLSVRWFDEAYGIKQPLSAEEAAEAGTDAQAAALAAMSPEDCEAVERALTEETTTTPPPPPHCNRDHVLAVSTYAEGAYADGWYCDRCRAQYDAGTSRFFCQTCEFDVCNQCASGKKKTSAAKKKKEEAPIFGMPWRPAIYFDEPVPYSYGATPSRTAKLDKVLVKALDALTLSDDEVDAADAQKQAVKLAKQAAKEKKKKAQRAATSQAQQQQQQQTGFSFSPAATAVAAGAAAAVSAAQAAEKKKDEDKKEGFTFTPFPTASSSTSSPTAASAQPSPPIVFAFNAPTSTTAATSAATTPAAASSSSPFGIPSSPFGSSTSASSPFNATSPPPRKKH